MAIHVDQRAAGIAGIDGGVGLDEILVVGEPDLGARQRRDDAARHRLPDTERIADGEHEIAHFEIVGIGELDGRERLVRAADAEHREVRLLVLEDQLGRELPAIVQRDLDLRFAAAADHVVVGDDDPVAGDEDAGAERVLDALLRHAEPLAEETPEEGVLEERRHHLLDPVTHIDVDHRRRRPLHDRREGLLDLGLALGHDPLLRADTGRGEKQGRHDERPDHANLARKFFQKRHRLPC